ncbi:MAG: hypothetical protein EOO29_21525 [Comamonadaceae bacterium]|nr:MAG: hypothetical protein EOO29_21525 [Comamonadaceae bacterium]
MRIFQIHASHVQEHADLGPLLTASVPLDGFLWLSVTREDLQAELPTLQTALQTLGGSAV